MDAPVVVCGGEALVAVVMDAWDGFAALDALLKCADGSLPLALFGKGHAFGLCCDGPVVVSGAKVLLACGVGFGLGVSDAMSVGVYRLFPLLLLQLPVAKMVPEERTIVPNLAGVELSRTGKPTSSGIGCFLCGEAIEEMSEYPAQLSV